MQIAAYTNTNSSEQGLRSQQPRVVPGLRPPPPGAGPFDRNLEDVGEWQGSQLPGLYLLLLSRVENSVNNDEDTQQTLARLERLLARRLHQLPAAMQRRLAALPDFLRLGLNDLGQLPGTVRAGLRGGAQADALLALLKAPTFVAAMKDTPQVTTYGPRGLGTMGYAN